MWTRLHEHGYADPLMGKLLWRSAYGNVLRAGYANGMDVRL